MKPPVLAAWLLNRLVPDEGIAGDLSERFTERPSVAWYWRQVLLAIALHTLHHIRRNKVLTARTGLAACGLLIAWMQSTRALYLWASHRWVNAWVIDAWAADHSSALYWNWIVYGGHLHWVWCVGALVTGCLMVRLNPTHPGTAIFASMIAQLPLTLLWGLPVWARSSSLPPTYALAHRLVVAVVVIGVPLSVLLGGLAGTQPLSLKRRSA